ncbi:hypothetical protein [Acinetobacter guillouiae]|uniref:hypothetical protein n=1 Tax=Acinetobacter guillouiae TaxID=106649 RepID=UPI00334110A7
MCNKALLIACQDKKVDWAQVNLPIPLDYISKDYEILPYYSYEKQNLDLYKSYDKNLMYFKGTTLDGKVLLDNSAVLYTDKKSKKIVAITLFTEDKKNTDKLLKVIDENLGSTDYHYFYGDSAVPTTDKLWKKGEKYYTLRIKEPDHIFGKKTKTASFTIFNSSSDTFIRWWFYDGGDFSGFYGQYLDELKKIDNVNKKFSYRDFVKKMDREDKNYGTTSHFFVE